MGTKALFNIFSKESEDSVFKKAIGMLSDGTENNLKLMRTEFAQYIYENNINLGELGTDVYLADFCYKFNKKYGMDIFVCLRSEASWLSNEAFFNPFDNSICINGQLFNDKVELIDKSILDLKLEDFYFFNIEQDTDVRDFKFEIGDDFFPDKDLAFIEYSVEAINFLKSCGIEYVYTKNPFIKGDEVQDFIINDPVENKDINFGTKQIIVTQSELINKLSERDKFNFLKI